jgi:hypothetical protein
VPLASRSRPWARAALLAGALACARAMADPVDDARIVSADPDTPAFGFSRRNLNRGSVGARIPLHDGPVWRLEIPVMIELQNQYGNLLPNNYWRGLLSGVVQRKLASGMRLEFGVHHESDHETVEPSTVSVGQLVGFYELNFLAAGLYQPLVLHGQQLVASTSVRLHVVSCNSGLDRCSTGKDGWGSPAFEGTVELTWTGPARETKGLRPEASLFADLLLPNGLVREEHRLVVNAGAWLPTAHGTFHCFVIGWLGNDVGFTRAQHDQQLGLGCRWIP